MILAHRLSRVMSGSTARLPAVGRRPHGAAKRLGKIAHRLRCVEVKLLPSRWTVAAAVFKTVPQRSVEVG